MRWERKCNFCSYLSVQYLLTLFDFIIFKRPKRFFEAAVDDPTRYVHPLGFLTTNLTFAAALAFTTARSGAAPTGDELLSHGAATMMIVVIATFHCFIAVLIGKSAGYLLNEVTTAATLFHAFCYTSVFYLGFAPLLPFFFDESNLHLRLKLSIVLTSLQLVATGYLLVSMARASSLHGRRLLAFVSLCGSVVTVLLGLVPIAVMGTVIKNEHENYAFSVCEAAERWPSGAITLPAQGRNSSVVVLMGATLGNRTGEWFDFGSSLEMKSSIPAKHGLGYARDLTPNTKYYFRYVTEHGAATCYGHVSSFKTDPL